MTSESGKWMRDIHPFTNIYGRRWRVVHIDGSVTTGTCYGAPYPPYDPSLIEWFFEQPGPSVPKVEKRA
jgi:hypothetical protein